MVVKMMKWRPWPPLCSKKFEAKIVVHCLKGLSKSSEEVESPMGFQDFERLAVEIRWKGSVKVNPLTLNSLRRSVRRNFTKEGSSIRDGGVVQWNEGFWCECNFSAYKDNNFLPWEGLSKGPTNKVPPIATGSLNLADFASSAKEKDVKISIPLEISNCCSASSPLLCLSLNLVELGNDHEALETAQKLDISHPVYPTCGEVLSKDRNDASPLRVGLGKVGIFKAFSVRGRKKAYCEDEGSDGRSSVRSEDTEYNYPVDTDSLSDSEEGESEEGNEDCSTRKTLNYETLACANYARGSYYSNLSSENEDWIYYSHRKSDAGCIYLEDTTGSVLDQSILEGSKRRILPWGKGKLSFRSPKSKGEPLLKKHYGEEGGDDIDFDRRQLSSSDESSYGWRTEESPARSQSSVSEFGDDSFAVGNWEAKEIISRDGQMKLLTQVFFASIDQRSERAAGESACTALVVAIADWFHSNHDEMPIKSQLDGLIHEGSLEWRNLCEEESYRERFPDKHFDLETVLHAKASSLSVVPQKSFIGFFHPEGIEDEGFDFLKGAMSFDNIWDEISKSSQESTAIGDTSIYIVSWNDHFFVLKVDQDAYYIIDTLGERLYEGCNQAFILRFDRDTTISQVANETQQAEDASAGAKREPSTVNAPTEKEEESATACSNRESDKKEQESIICRGKDACKEYIKSFLAAIPIRELEVDLKKGLVPSMPLHQRLQIEFHYTEVLSPCAGGVEPTANLSETLSMEVK